MSTSGWKSRRSCPCSITAKVGLGPEALRRPLAHVAVEQLVAGPAAFLRPVHRGVGVPDDGLRALGGPLGDGDPQARRGHDFAALELDRLGHGAGQPVGDVDGVLLALDVLQKDHELVTAEARRGVLRTKGGAEPRRHPDENRVSHLVPPVVVDDLEVVEVEEQHRDQALLSLGPGQSVAQVVHEQRPVREIRERVVKRLAGKLLLGPLPLGDVADDAGDHPGPRRAEGA
jgi:hypothetical protein